MTEANCKTDYNLLGIQYLRAVAAISVLIFHISETYQLGFHVGSVGVDLFFVISGLIIWITTANKQIGPIKFIFRRITRIVPVYWIVTFLTFVSIQLKPQFFFDHHGSIANFSRSLFFIPDVDENGMHPVVLQGWTLTYEMFFYTLFAIGLLTRQSLRPVILAGVIGLLASVHTAASGTYLAVLTDPIMIEFAAGVLLGWAVTNGARINPFVSITLVVIGTTALFAPAIAYAELPRFIGRGAPCLLIVCGIVFFELTKGMPNIRWLQFLGDASYSIYIWQGLAAVMITALILRMAVPLNFQPVALMTGTLTLTIVAYVIIERPLNHVFHQRRRKTISKPALTGLSAVKRTASD